MASSLSSPTPEELQKYAESLIGSSITPGSGKSSNPADDPAAPQESFGAPNAYEVSRAGAISTTPESTRTASSGMPQTSSPGGSAPYASYPAVPGSKYPMDTLEGQNAWRAEHGLRPVTQEQINASIAHQQSYIDPNWTPNHATPSSSDVVQGMARDAVGIPYERPEQHAYGHNAPSSSNGAGDSTGEIIPHTQGPGGGSIPSLSQVTPYTSGSEALVEDRMTGLLASGNPYIEAAQQRGLRQAHARGLLNSSIATQAGEAAAIEAAFPIASQDAGYYQGLGLSAQQGNIQSRLAREQYGYDLGIIGAQEGASSRLKAQDIAATAELSAQEAAQLMELEEFRSAAETSMREQLAGMQLTSEEKRVLGDQITKLGNEFLLQVSNVQRDPEVSWQNKPKVIADLQALYQSQMESLGNIYGIEIDWVLPVTLGY